MSKRRSPLVPVLLAAVLLVGAANIGAYAATGGPLLLGKSNTASKTTTLKTTGNGAALKLKSKAGKAPLKVSNNTKVKKLNADLVDGLEGDALKTKSFVYTLTSPTIVDDYVSFQLPGLPAGRYHASFNISALVTGAPSFFACFIVSGTGVAINAPVVGIAGVGGGDFYFATGTGYVDTTAAAHRVVCQRSGGTNTTIPILPNFPARVIFTRVDDVTAAGSTGAGSTAPRHRVIR